METEALRALLSQLHNQNMDIMDRLPEADRLTFLLASAQISGLLISCLTDPAVIAAVHAFVVSLTKQD
jgi:hypothetical protein